MLRQHKLHCIAQLLELPAMAVPPSHYYSITPPAYINMGQTQPYDLSTQHARPTSPGQSGTPATAAEPPALQSTGETSHHEYPQASMEAPGQCLSPGTGTRTTSQAQALANVLQHSESPPNERVGRSDINENASGKITRALSVEEACEAIELESRRKWSHPSVENVRENESTSTSTTSSEPGTRSHSLENLSTQNSTVRTASLSRSAPATPRGERHPPPVDPSEHENVARLAAQNSMSEPAIFFNGDWNEPAPETNQHVVKKTKKAGNKKGGAPRGKGRQRKR